LRRPRREFKHADPGAGPYPYPEPMTTALHERETLATASGYRIHVDFYRDAAEPRCIVQLLHGLGEHAGRYRRLAGALAAAGYGTVVHDHRGHGEHAILAGFFAEKKGWQTVVDDALAVHELIGERYPGTPVVLLGHSMGSFLAQSFAMHHGGRLAGLVLSGSGWPSRATVVPGWLLARAIAASVGRRGESALLDRIGFGNFNRRFEPARTPFDWLSRDEAEVDKYVADPLCGGPYSAGLWLDLLGGLIEISSDNALTRIPADLPILIMGGADDPVGGEDSMAKLAMHYAQTGHQRISLKSYPQGRHEMLNETNRDEVTADLIDWLGKQAKKPAKKQAPADATSDKRR